MQLLFVCSTSKGVCFTTRSAEDNIVVSRGFGVGVKGTATHFVESGWCSTTTNPAGPLPGMGARARASFRPRPYVWTAVVAASFITKGPEITSVAVDRDYGTLVT